MRNPSSTIAAVATPPGTGGIAVIRVSGAETLSVLSRVFRPKSGKPVASLAPRTAVYGDIIWEDQPIDDGLLTLFPAPHSYTGEDMAELSCHGGALVTQTVLSAILSAGALPAERGEFTRRAFISGKLSLSDAEAVATLLSASTTAQLKLSTKRSRSRLSAAIEEVHHSLVSVMASLFAAIDFPDEDLAPMSREELKNELLHAEEGLDRLLKSYHTGRAVKDGIRTVICGKPNVGKSTLYNLLSGEDLAIVTDVAGTTRDVLSTKIACGRVLLALSDTAGIRETGDTVERLGVERSRRAMEEAELCLAVFDASRPVEEEDRALLRYLAELSAVKICVINKSDRAEYDLSEIRNAFPHTVSITAGGEKATAEPLASLVNRLFTDETLVIGEDAILSGARQYAAVKTAKEAVADAINALQQGLYEDAVSVDITRAIAALGETDGREVNEDVVGEIFSHFCVGK